MTADERLKAYGSSDLYPEQRIFKAGQLSLTYENGSIRWIKFGDVEIIRMIYSAVRDRNWGTIEPEIVEEKIQTTVNSFEIELKVVYVSGPIYFVAVYHISGADNKIRFEMLGTAQSDFLKNRIGFCVLHPIRKCAGKSGKVFHSDSSVSDFRFPEFIAPHQPVKNIQSMSWEPADAIEAKLCFSGDIFEMEDQRNWTDASFKTYCTPLDLPFPAEIKYGETVSQVVELTVQSELRQENAYENYNFSWDADQLFKLPELGTAVSSRNEILSETEVEILKKLPLNHLRVEFKMKEVEVLQRMEKASQESILLDWPLFVVLYLSENYLDEIRLFVSKSEELKLNVKYLLPVGADHLPCLHFNNISQLIKASFPDILIGIGVNAYFAELNRAQPSIENADFVSFTVCPQVHAFNCASMAENLEAQVDVVRSAQNLFPDKPVFVSPVSLKQRFNVVSTSDDPIQDPRRLPDSVDVRQLSVFAAIWTLGSLKFLSSANAGLVSYYETVGWKGFFQGQEPSGLMEIFPSEANRIFPVYEAIKEITGDSFTALSKSSHPILFDGLVVKSDREVKLFLFSFVNKDIEVNIQPLIKSLETRSLLYDSKPELYHGFIKLRAWDLLIIKFGLNDLNQNF